MNTQENQPLSMVVRDRADKVGSTHAVVWRGELLPVRFPNHGEAMTHLQQMREKAA